MRYREITRDQAHEVIRVLITECGFTPRDRDGDMFVNNIVTADKANVCHEYRFQGALGFGGKFRNNGNYENTPHVDCYPENETPERRAMIGRANARLRELFAPTSPVAMERGR